PGGGNTFPGIGLRKFGTATNEFNIVGLTPSPATNAQMESFVAGQNPASASGTFGTGGVAAVNGSSNNWTAIASVPQLAVGGEGAGAAWLASDQLPAILAEAVRRWEAIGLSPTQAAALEAVRGRVADLADGYLGAASVYGNTIYVDVNAAGHGWFVDPTPADDTEFGR